MPDYGIKDADAGLLAWDWAETRLTASHDYWVATTWPDGRPHLSPVWGVWMDGAVWFSCGPKSRKARNLGANPRCSIATDNAYEPVLLEGEAILDADADAVKAFTAASNAKYAVDYSVEFFASNHLYRVPPMTVISLNEADFTGSPTRWTFNRT